MAFGDDPNPFALTPAQERLVMDHSVERMINSAIELGAFCQNNPRKVGAHISELGSTNWQDFHDLKETLVTLWNERRNDIFKRSNKLASG